MAHYTSTDELKRLMEQLDIVEKKIKQEHKQLLESMPKIEPYLKKQDNKELIQNYLNDETKANSLEARLRILRGNHKGGTRRRASITTPLLRKGTKRAHKRRQKAQN